MMKTAVSTGRRTAQTRLARSVVAMAALALVTAMPPPAAAEPASVVGPFAEICLEPGRKADAIAVARRQGYVTPPKFIGDGFLSSMPAGEATMLWKVVDGGFLGAFFMEGPLSDSGELIGETCGLFVAPAEPELERRIVAYLGVGDGGGEAADEYKSLIFEETAGVRRRVDPESLDFARVLGTDRLHMVMYGAIKSDRSGEMTMVMHIRPRLK